MIRVTCPSCRSRLNAKDELIGQTRKCPGCGKAIVIQADLTADSPDASVAEALTVSPPVSPPADTAELSDFQRPTKLERSNKYLVADHNRILATWGDNGQGWLVKTVDGIIQAKRSTEGFPSQGTFVLVELRMNPSDTGRRLAGALTFRLASHWALQALARADNAILQKIVGPGALGKQQKAAVLTHLRQTLMPDMWHDSQAVVDYLTNTDYHSQGVR